ISCQVYGIIEFSSKRFRSINRVWIMIQLEETLRIAAKVGTPLGALCVLLVLMYFLYLAKLKYDQKKLEALPLNKRAVIADEYLTRYGIHGRDLPVETKILLIREEMGKRYGLSWGRMIIAALLI